jgi:hypothetical protein
LECRRDQARPSGGRNDEKNRATMLIDNQNQLVNDALRERRLLLERSASPLDHRQTPTAKAARSRATRAESGGIYRRPSM